MGRLDYNFFNFGDFSAITKSRKIQCHPRLLENWKTDCTLRGKSLWQYKLLVHTFYYMFCKIVENCVCYQFHLLNELINHRSTDPNGLCRDFGLKKMVYVNYNSI